jgi:hypothetical protein
MIEMTYAQLNNQGFDQAIQRLMMLPLSMKAAGLVKELCEDVLLARDKTGKEFFQEVVAPRTKKDESGKIVLNDKGKPEISPEMAAEIDTIMAEWAPKTVKLDREKLYFHMLGDFTLSAVDLSLFREYLDPVLTGLSVVPNEAEPA